MKYFLVLIFSVVSISFAQGQTLAEKIAIMACTYLDSINIYNVLLDSIESSIVSATTILILEGAPEETKVIGSVEGIRETLKAANEILPVHCDNVRRLIIKEKRRKFYKRSSSYAANKHYDKGNSLMEKGDYQDAIKEFKLAVKLDNNFVYAIDHIAVCYRRLGEYKTAIKYYNKSLDIFPEGDIAIMNIAATYSFIKDDNNSIKNYRLLKYLYPDNPEGYYGLAKMLSVNGDDEEALDNLFTAHKLYLESNSEYLKDSKLLMKYLISKLKSLNKMDLVEKKAKEYNIVINEE